MRHENCCRKPVRLAIVAGLISVSLSLSAAVTYDFKQVSQSDFENPADGEITGTGFIDGHKSRVEVKTGNMPGSYIIARNDTQMLFVVDPLNKRFHEINAAQVASAFGSSKIQITNFKSNVTRLNDRPIVADLPTEHLRVTLAYDITVMFGTLPLRQSVVTTIDKWVTQAYGELTDPALTRGTIRTGNKEIDQMIEAENSKVKGFPLRQVTTTSTTSMGAEQTAGTKLKMKPVRRQSSELVITRISPTVVSPTLFEVPAHYAKVDASHTEEPAVHMINMQP